MTKEIGQAIHQSAKLLSQAGQEINSLMRMIKETINNKIEKDGFGNNLVIHRNWFEDSRTDDSGFLWNQYSENLGIKKGNWKRKDAQMYLNIQISLDGDGMTHEETNNLEPLIHISLWGAHSDVNNSVYFALKMDETEEVTLQNEVLLNWAPDAKDWTEQSWTYSLKLTSLNSLDNIETKIIQPIQALLGSNSAETAGLNTLDGIVKYHELRSGVYQVQE